MALILRLRQTLLSAIMPEIEYASKIVMGISDILSFDRRSS